MGTRGLRVMVGNLFRGGDRARAVWKPEVQREKPCDLYFGGREKEKGKEREGGREREEGRGWGQNLPMK